MLVSAPIDEQRYFKGLAFSFLIFDISSSEIVLGLYGHKMSSKTKNPKPATDPYPATHHIILAHSAAAAAAKHKENYQVKFKLPFQILKRA